MNPIVDCEEAVRMMQKTSDYIENIVKTIRPDLLNTFYTYSNEAIQARKILSQDLLNLKYGDAILEVGAGILALSTQLSREGFKVTAVEPIQEGFEEINFIMNLYLTLSINDGIGLKLVKSQIELSQFTEKFDYIFAFNVFEHISKPYEVVKQLKSELKQNSSLRILCPNYNFPYEPHFRRILFLRKNKAFSTGQELYK
jgi:2-polyprenyl-3-methyl-5-hydroxy-6-metoxy-1,4-benzoquinol methylase